MKHLVNAYLLVTGIVAALVLMMPWLVIIGTFMLILPGLILAAAPTAFLWGVAFAVPWYMLRSMLGDFGAIVPAALIGGALLWLAPQPSIALSKLQLHRSIHAEVVPTAQLRLAGHIRVDYNRLAIEKSVPGAPYDRSEIEARPYVCDALCAALLATPGVQSVTVNDQQDAMDGGAPLTGHARTFRLVPKAQCAGPTIRPQDPDSLGITHPPSRGMKRQLVRPLQAEWDVRLSTTDCIVAEPARTTYDFVIRKHSYRRFASAKPADAWALGPQPVTVERLDIVDSAGRVVLSKTLASTRALVAPLIAGPEGGLENFRFQWARRLLSNGKRYEQFKPDQLLADHTNLRTDVDYAAIVKASRDRLARAVDDPALPATDAAFMLSAPWFNSLEKQSFNADDLALLIKVTRDRRVVDFSGFWNAIEVAGSGASKLREPMVERAGALDETSPWQAKTVGKVLDQLPAGTFATISATERAILADPARRRFAPGLISRQSDRGAAAVPMLLDILEFHLRAIADAIGERRSSGDGDMVAVDRVRVAFCTLGPDARDALPRIDRLASEGLIDRRFAEQRDWQLMLVRIGKPVAAIPKPHDLSGTEDQFHRNLQQRLERFRPDRDCRAYWS